jgi:hypothetical protein
MQQMVDAPPRTSLTYSLRYLATATMTPVTTGSYSYVLGGQAIEGYNISDFMFGTSSAVPLTLSFWVKASRFGTFSMCIENANEDRQLILPYTVNSVGTWEYKTVQIMPCYDGVWNNNTTALGMFVHLLSMPGYPAISTIGWRTITPTYAYVLSNSIAPLQVNGDYIQFTGVQLEKGTIATPFEIRPFAVEFQLCQRYFDRQRLINGESGIEFAWCGASSTVFTLLKSTVIMRAIPSIVFNPSVTSIQFRSNRSTTYNITGFSYLVWGDYKAWIELYTSTSPPIGTPGSLSYSSATSYEFSAEL